MTAEKQGLIFISYSRTNRGFALELAKELKASGFLVWLDQLDIPTGARWDDEIEKALTNCEIFMVILTPQSIASHNVKDEIGYAIDSNKRILPILLEQANVPFRLRRFQYVDFTNKSNNEGIDAAKQLLRKLMDEPTEPRQDAAADQGSQPKIDRSAELKADANRLARQKAEAIRRAREQEQRERASQISQQAPPPPEERLPQGRPQTQTRSRLVPIIAGVSILLLLCLGGGWIAWPYIFPPTHTPPPPITLTTPPPTITRTPTHTPIGPGPIPTTITPSVTIPAHPIDFIEFYYENINNQNYDLTWSLLSEQYKAERNPDGKGPYMDFWNSVSFVEIYSLAYTEISNSAAIVIMDSSITSTPLNYYLVWDSSRNTWLFNPMPESFDVTCSRAPKTLRPGSNAEVATARDTLALRTSPTDDYTVIERMDPGTVVYVLEGPECNYYRSENIFYWWWKVQSPTGNQGWVVEGSDAVDPVFLKPAQ
ncbi:MAG: TIR domain-containing protein [Anaerolineales bacterium]|nr:TIR domain-containing protein [Anaerolineales bacterium]